MAHTILVIGSESTQRDMLCTLLKERFGYQAKGMTSGCEAINYIMTDQIPKADLILFDVSSVDSYGTITNLKMLASHTPIVTLVKYGDYDTAMATLAAGAQDFLTKPVAVERIGATLRNSLLLRDTCRDAERKKHEQLAQSPAAASFQSDPLPFPFIGEDGNICPMEDIQAGVIRFAIQHYNGCMTEVARRLGIGRSTLYRKLSDMNGRQAPQAPVSASPPLPTHQTESA